MKAIRIVLVLFVGSIIINFIKNDQTFHIAKTLPFSNNPERVGFYDAAGVAALLILAWGLYRLKSRNKEDE